MRQFFGFGGSAAESSVGNLASSADIGTGREDVEIAALPLVAPGS